MNSPICLDGEITKVMRRINLARHGTGNEIDPGAERIKAMKGLAFDLDLNWKESRCYGNNRAAVVRGIRHHLSFAQGPIITALCTGEDAEKNLDFRRARNARLIMSNIIPSAKELGIDGTKDGEPPQDTSKLPYCIWHPEFASEETYRVLAVQYPLFRYPVGRACAAAGYDKLYFELGLLPDVSIAEEARESKAPGAKIIYDTVMASPARYTILDDRTMSKPDDATLSELCALAPTMRETAVIAAIMCDYDDVFYSYKIVPPTQGIFLAAKFSKNPWYLEQVLADARECGIEFDETDDLEHQDLQYIRQRPEEPMRNWEWPLYHQYDGVEFEDVDDLEYHNELEVGKVFHRLFSTRESREKIPLKRRN
ncbi:hypothetical protein K4F52_001548 [Lecanicillium sp. MT-2017a]|nr:hypothetical protein K4F52_001548 [Lecanicillium sp. MT-2017a]